MEESVGGAPSVSAVLLEEMVVVLVSPPNKELKKADMVVAFVTIYVRIQSCYRIRL